MDEFLDGYLLGIHVRFLLILNFPSGAPNDWLLEQFTDMGFEVESVIGKSRTKKMEFQANKSVLAFVNCKSPGAASAMKRACDEGRVVLSAKGKRWNVKADWANRRPYEWTTSDSESTSWALG